MSQLVLEALDGDFTIHRLDATETIPSAVFGSPFYWIGRTDEELSVVCDSSLDLGSSEKSPGWACLKVLGPVDLSATGVVAGISAALASAQVSICVVSTFDTDYVLVQSAQLGRAKSALIESGYGVKGPRDCARASRQVMEQ